MNQCDRIRQILKENKLKQKQFASVIGVTESYISKLLKDPNIRLSQSLAVLIEEKYGYARMEVNLDIHRQRIHLLRGGVEQFVVAEITNLFVGHFHHELVAGIVVAEPAFVLALLVNFVISVAQIDGVIQRGIVVVVLVTADSVVRRETDHTVTTHIARREADRTVVVNQLLGDGAAVIPVPQITAPPIAPMLADITVVEIERVAVGLPYHRLFYNLRTEVVDRLYFQIDILKRTDNKERVFVEFLRRGARRRGNHLEPDGDGVGRGGVPSGIHIAERGTRTAQLTIDVPFECGRIAATLHVNRLDVDVFEVAN